MISPLIFKHLVFIFLVSDSNGCYATSSPFYFGVSSILDFNNTELTIYPNPSPDFISIIYHSMIENVEIYNINGKRIKSIRTDGNTIDIKDLKIGTYYINILFKDNQFFKSKFIKI